MFVVHGTAGGQASVIVIEILLALGRFGSSCRPGHDDLKEKHKEAPQFRKLKQGYEQGDTARADDLTMLGKQLHQSSSHCIKLW